MRRTIVTFQSRLFLPKSRTEIGAWAPLGTSVTDSQGRFRKSIPAGPSRSILVTGGENSGAEAPEKAAKIFITVAAGIVARPTRTRIRNGHSVVFRGQVDGPIPRGGVLVALEVRDSGRWVPVATTRRWVRTSSAGAFTLSYRFLSTFRPTAYKFRVVADEDSAFQYARGSSRSITVNVRP
jgi:hypothetical protein